MAARKVIADSEDEDEGDEILLLRPEGDVDRPEPEPLSPDHQPSSPTAAASEHHNQSSDITNPSFFANIYENQQLLAVQQSNLVENIVRQSQRASASSGDVSLPALKRRRVNPSSGTDVTSPRAPGRPRNRTTVLTDDASEFTTPRKSTGQEWDIPSSPENAAASCHTQRPTSRGETHGERKRRKLKLPSSPAAPISGVAKTTPKAPLEDADAETQVDGVLTAGAVSTPPARNHDFTLPDTTKFYIAQSNLTTMQKLEYQKVNVSNGYGGLPGSLPHQKSSGVTTIAYSTPSGYSPVPPLPWEEPLVASPQHNNIINMISSSPNMADSGFELLSQGVPVTNIEVEVPVANESHESPGVPQGRTPVSKGKRRARHVIEEDELCRDDPWDADDIDALQNSYNPRPTKRRLVGTRNPADIGENVNGLEDITSDPMPPTQSPPKLPVLALLDTDPVEPPPTEPPPEAPRKRGRKKKQPVSETPPTPTEANNDSQWHQTRPSPHESAAVEPSLEKPKKRRGRPRKSEPSKLVEESLPEPFIADGLPENDLPQENNGLNEPGVVKRQKYCKEKKRSTVEEDDPLDLEEDRPPLKEVDSNIGTPSKSVSAQELPESASAESGDKISTPKIQSRETPTLGALQSKVRYRVGLSRRSRIAPLLKSIRK
ncbi:hypothetical protein F5B22DRAFT_79175 [Xylaria bambusicola]|uniref:uncharacterized protein n=1 Tax=Xylaria bambusicola TaxID=326684 RepID=UPI0020072558|nr:uncharacterized protein F5B22DRAFT_79175 [Xylaria bambusicola]KAI0518264.1 hypothetical protein F5B22DRAFT_79175 [Xylaria bambusicola]